MTGYGLGRAQSISSSIEVSLRSVNGRYLETRFHLPREFIAFESDLKKVLNQYIERGTLDIFVSRRLKPGAKKAQVTVNSALAKQYLQAFTKLSKELKIPNHLHIEHFARLPEIVKLEEDTEISTTEKKILLQAFEKACQAADAERKREGKFLRADLEKLLQQLDDQVSEIQKVREEANQNLQQKFEQKIKAKFANLEVDSARLSQEVVLQIEKTDINEELTRLKEHIKNYKQLLSEGQSQGKKLDFYTQELLREVNTIGSKSSLSRLTQIVVQAKTYIERIREQVQNVE